jgi:phenylpropionate dioxygenase-like ring-hydroxylating dioxygenase large terminal subunit
LSEKQVAFPKSWYPLCRSSEIKPRQVIKREGFGVSFAVFRTESGRAGAVLSECIHMGADLSRGRVTGERLQCPLHEWEYGLEGRCEHIPASASIPSRARQRSLVCREQYGMVFGFLGGEPEFDFPLFENSDHDIFSAPYMMDFDTPYQVLAANSFDSQHFITVHHRRLLEAPSLSHLSRHHFGVDFRARVEGGHFHDRLLRNIGVDVVELSAHCWGGNNILAYNARTNARILFTIMPLTDQRTRVYILNVMPAHTARWLPRPIRRIILWAMHRLTIAFLKSDIVVMRDLQFKLGVLLRDADHVFIQWVKYWKSLPHATLKG